MTPWVGARAMALALAVLAALTELVASHGQLTWPPSRTGGNLQDAGGCPAFTFSNGHDFCAWFEDGVTIPHEPTLDPALITTDALSSGSDWTHNNPWRSPGSTPLAAPCGSNSGRNGVDLPPKDVVNVLAGSSIELAWAINANHGGGYSYRLCSAGEELTETCFQRTPLNAANDWSYLQVGDDKSTRRKILTNRTTAGTFPVGSQWTRNPIPDRSNYFPPPLSDPSLIGHGPFNWSIVDEYWLPRDLQAGRYVLSWRWDCEGTEQVWANCADLYVSAHDSVTDVHI
eukprot:gb/GFBE01014907.1/.p1 GENE.gb/GFBE01014907.1/~~gb/GFBE01014907.1/.p1  ORF type:complete len:286 (+),score=36.82 gb/GFBE01014907.1/:1-858(+)